MMSMTNLKSGSWSHRIRYNSKCRISSIVDVFKKYMNKSVWNVFICIVIRGVYCLMLSGAAAAWQHRNYQLSPEGFYSSFERLQMPMLISWTFCVCECVCQWTVNVSAIIFERQQRYLATAIHNCIRGYMNTHWYCLHVHNKLMRMASIKPAVETT